MGKTCNENIKVDLGSDQTSLHNPWAGGYYPVGMTLEESKLMMAEQPELFRERVQESLRRQVAAINKLTDNGMYFFDYGNAFLLQSQRANADILKPDGKFKYPSYVQDIMGPMFFDYGFGPFRWVCTSGDPKDLETTDRIATEVMETIKVTAPDEIKGQMDDNIHWIKEAGKNHLVVGSQARILYADAEGRAKIALAFNEAIKKGEITRPIVLGRDHHDVSGTDSPFRETSNIYDGSQFCADMAVQNVIGALSEVLLGYQSTTAVELAGAKLSMVASVWLLTEAKAVQITLQACFSGTLTTVSRAAVGLATKVL